MQKEGSPRLLRHHDSSVKGITFSPRDRYHFASGGSDGKVCFLVSISILYLMIHFSLQVNLYSASTGEHLIGYQLQSGNQPRHITGIKYTCDGRRILAATNARRMTVLDVDRGEQIQCFDNCAFNARERIPLATDPHCPNLAVCACVNGKGLTLFDLRMPLPLDFVLDLHSSPIRDITFLGNSWPFLRSHQSGLVSLSADGVCKVTTLDGRTLNCFEVGHSASCIAITPEPFSSTQRSRRNNDVSTGENKDPSKFASLMVIGGECLSRYRGDTGVIERQEMMKPVVKCFESPPTTPTTSCPSTPTNTPSSTPSSIHITRVMYTSNGSLLYACTNTGVVKRYRRYPDGNHRYLGDVIHHKGEVYDMDMSPYDEYLVTASRDKHVGLLCLGAPNHGWTGFCELT